MELLSIDQSFRVNSQGNTFRCGCFRFVQTKQHVKNRFINDLIDKSPLTCDLSVCSPSYQNLIGIWLPVTDSIPIPIPVTDFDWVLYKDSIFSIQNVKLSA